MDAPTPAQVEEARRRYEQAADACEPVYARYLTALDAYETALNAYAEALDSYRALTARKLPPRVH